MGRISLNLKDAVAARKNEPTATERRNIAGEIMIARIDDYADKGDRPRHQLGISRMNSDGLYLLYIQDAVFKCPAHHWYAYSLMILKRKHGQRQR